MFMRSHSTRRRWCLTVAPTACAVAAVLWVIQPAPLLRVEARHAVRLQAHWMGTPITAVAGPLGTESGSGLLFRDQTADAHSGFGSLDLHSLIVDRPLPVVPRFPSFKTLQRAEGAPPAPNGSIHVSRPRVTNQKVNCLTTRAPGLRTRTLSTWTLEIVTMFLPSRSLGHDWLTVFGRNGRNFTTSTNQSAGLASLYMKLGPNLLFHLEAWGGCTGTCTEAKVRRSKCKQKCVRAAGGGTIKYAKITSRRRAGPNTWYSIVASSDGSLLRLYINGDLEGATRIYGPLREPPWAADGDVTVGCGMFAGAATDACSCLITEARVSETARSYDGWLWTPTWRVKQTRGRI